MFCFIFLGTCGLSVTTFFHQVLNYYYLTVYIMFKPKMSSQCTLKGQARYVNVWGSVHWKGVYRVRFIKLKKSGDR